MRVLLLVMGSVACAPELESDLMRETEDPEASGLLDDGSADPDWEGRDFDARLEQDPQITVGQGPRLVADSVAEYSAEQGLDGWSYGYVEPDGLGVFVPMPFFNGGGADPGWYAATGGVFWTMMDADSMHPNGEITTGGRSPVEQWAVRRWTSDEAGTLQVTGHFAKLSIDGESNGVAAYLYVDGVLSWAWYLEGWDAAGIDFSKTITVAEGSTVDFVLDPWEADDRSDRSVLTAQLWAE